MMKIEKHLKLFGNDVKCMSDDAKWAGGASKSIKNLQTEVEIDTASSVNSMKSFGEKILFGLDDGRIGILDQNNSIEYAKIHAKNVCTLDCCDGCILSGSWDHKAVFLVPCDEVQADICIGGIFYINRAFEHPNAVWKVHFINKHTFATGCADNSIRIFKNNTLFKTLSHHSNVVRSFCIDGNFIYSVDNYGKLIKVTIEGKILKFRDLGELCFGMCRYKDLFLVCGENGHVFAVNSDLQVLFKTRVPSTTCWNINVYENKIYVACSGGMVYVLTVDDNEPNKDEDSEEVESTAQQKAGSQGLPDQTFVSGGVKYKSENNKIYMETPSGWELIGSSGDNYDHSFDVELEGKTYVLSFNDDENVHEVATRFLRKNKINLVHHQDIVDYINKNFKKSSLFKKYDSINIEGISKLIPDHPILQIIKNISDGNRYSIVQYKKKNIYQIEEALFDFKKIPLFVILDICKYLYFKNVRVDLSFLFDHEFMNKKEAKAFLFLMTNVIENPPFNLSKLEDKIRILRDHGYLELDDLGKYDNNLRCRKVANRV